MPLLTFPITQAGLVVDVQVNVEAALLLPLWQAGRDCPPIQTTGEIDTTSNVTGTEKGFRFVFANETF